MTRIDSVRTATGNARENLRTAAEVVAPHAEAARETAYQYAQEAGHRLAPKVSKAAHQARHTAKEGYEQYLSPRVTQARDHLPPEVERAAVRAAERTRQTARRAGEYARPHLEQAYHDARAAAGPAGEEAASRAGAAFSALRGDVTPQEIAHVTARRRRRARVGRFARRMAVVGLIAGAGYAAWRWWDKQANPDWLVEPPEATEVEERSALVAVNGTPAHDGQPEGGAEHASSYSGDASQEARHRGGDE